MLDSLNKYLVKNVNNQRINSSVSCDVMSTKIINLININIFICLQTQFINLNLLNYSTVIYTGLINKLNLLYKSYTYNPQDLLIKLKKGN
jgi:hypothetical protein